MSDESKMKAEGGVKPVPPVAPTRAWIRPLRDSYDEEGVETDDAPALLFAGHDTQDADASADATPCLEEDGFVRGEPAEYVRVDIYDTIATQLAEARAALEAIAALQTKPPLSQPYHSDGRTGIALGRWDAAEIARKALGGGR